MTPAQIAARVAAQKAATFARLHPVKLQARQAAEELQDTTRGLKQQAADNSAEREIIGSHPYDLFPTPPELAADMARRAGIVAGDYVLEPSAGTGRLAQAAKNAGAAVVLCVEINWNLVDRLNKNGFSAVQADFLNYKTIGHFEAVVMNPPFSNGADIDHVRHAYDLLTEGALVTIMSEGCFFRSDKKAIAFREWMNHVGGTSEKLPAETFKQSGTRVNARIVTLQKHT